MRNFKAAFAALVGLFWFGAPAHGMTLTQVAAGSCTTASSCTVNVTANIPAGSNIIVVAASAAYNFTGITIADNAGSSSNCNGYSVQTSKPTTANEIFVGYCMTTATAMTSGATCGAGGTSQCAFVVAQTGGSTNPWRVVAFKVTGINATTPFHAQGTTASGTWISGSATTFATSGALAWSSEDALGIVVGALGAASDTMGNYTGGFTLVGNYPGTAANIPDIFIGIQTLTLGTATFGGTPTSSAARAFGSQVFMFVNAGATVCGNSGGLMLLGVGGGGSCISAGSQLDFSVPSNSGLLTIQ